MPNFAVQLKAEISRLSRREIRNETKQLKKSSTQYRSDIATLKRRITSLEATIRRLAKGMSGQARPAAKEPEEKLRFRAGGFATLRKKLGLSAEQMGKLVGVSGQSIYHWESGKARPRASQLPAIAAVRGMGKREAAARLAK